MGLGKNIAALRKFKGMTQEKLAEQCNVSRQAVAKWERGETLPDLDNIIALADIYEVSIDFLVRNMRKLPTAEGDRKHMFGFTKINDKGQVTLPKKCRDVFGLSAGDALLILGDEDKGIALVKLSDFSAGGKE